MEPPGKQIYRKGSLVIHEVDPVINNLYCQLLCLMAKLFIEHKTVFYDVTNFLFYILYEITDEGTQLIGYFSKDRGCTDGYNLACILILPPYQRMGYGKLLISFAYELSKIDGLAGTPERPLSDLGLCSYLSYWSWVILDILNDMKVRTSFSIKDLSKKTSFATEDIIKTLKYLSLDKYWLDEETFCVQPAYVDELIKSKRFSRPRLTADPHRITFNVPYSLSKGLHFNGCDLVISYHYQEKTGLSTVEVYELMMTALANGDTKMMEELCKQKDVKKGYRAERELSECQGSSQINMKEIREKESSEEEIPNQKIIGKQIREEGVIQEETNKEAASKQRKEEDRPRNEKEGKMKNQIQENTSDGELIRQEEEKEPKQKIIMKQISKEGVIQEETNKEAESEQKKEEDRPRNETEEENTPDEEVTWQETVHERALLQESAEEDRAEQTSTVELCSGQGKAE